MQPSQRSTFFAMRVARAGLRVRLLLGTTAGFHSTCTIHRVGTRYRYRAYCIANCCVVYYIKPCRCCDSLYNLYSMFSCIIQSQSQAIALVDGPSKARSRFRLRVDQESHESNLASGTGPARSAWPGR